MAIINVTQRGLAGFDVGRNYFGLVPGAQGCKA